MSKFIQIKNGKPISCTIEDILNEHKAAYICDPLLGEISDDLLKNYNVYRLVECPKIDGENVVEGDPVYINGRWCQTWIYDDNVKADQ